MNVLKVRPSVLHGEVTVSGAKNSALKLLTASILTNKPVILRNYPSTLLDAQVHVGMLEALGKKCELIGDDTIRIDEPIGLSNKLVWGERSIRNTLLILGALTSRLGAGSVPLPGGCKLGDRAFDLHEMVLRTLGAEVWQKDDCLFAEAKTGRLTGADIYLPIRSTGATENAIISGCLSIGITRIWNPHIRPEILDLVAFLNAMGARIEVFGQEHIEVIGIDALDGTSHTVVPDNMEAITWAVATVMTGGDVEIRHFPHQALEVPLIHLRESGAKYFEGPDSLVVRGGTCYPLEVSTGPFPGINSDVQPILAAYAACAKGPSRIVDLRFPGRYGYSIELAKMGLECEISGDMLQINGAGGKLRGAVVRALDLRAGAALVLCGLVAQGETSIVDAWQIERGYNNFVDKLRALGGDIDVG